jgi:hypothetical protein
MDHNTLRNICPIDTQSIADPICTDQALNIGLHDDKSLTNHMCQDMAKFPFMYATENQISGRFQNSTIV